VNVTSDTAAKSPNRFVSCSTTIGFVIPGPLW
jgi:hypothetical protein